MDIEGVELKPGKVLIVATRKGIFFLQGSADRRNWQLDEPVFLGHIINHAVLDPRNGQTLMAAAVTGHLGPTIFRSEDAGRTWSEAIRPPAFDKAGPGQTPRVVSHTFWLTPGHPSEPGVWFAGTSPQALWTSVDDGRSWTSMRGFNDHADYDKRTEDPQAGTPDGPVLHSILVDPRDPAHMYFGLSGGGVYESVDHGESWAPLNQGMATASGEPDAVVGTDGMEIDYGDLAWQEMGPQHDPHSVQLSPSHPDILYQQNHCGIYRLQRPATTWERIGRNMPANVGDIGFVMGVHPRDPDVCWVFPMDGTDVWPRTSPDGKPAVFMSRDAGQSWERPQAGLPGRAWHTVKRQALSVDREDSPGVFFGTTSGELWGSIDEGANWECLTAHLPEIYAVEAATVL